MNYNYSPYNSMYQPQTIVQPQYPTIYGKIVDGVDAARLADVPVGSYAVFPTGDLSSIFVKSWNQDGTTRVTTFVQEQRGVQQNVGQYYDVLDNISQSLNSICKKLDVQPKQQPKAMKKTGGADDE